MSGAREFNFDGLVGPTHNYAGLSFGNLASAANRNAPARPREAALQGLAKMRALANLGLPQGVLPPLERPPMAFLRGIGFSGSDASIWEAAWRAEPAVMRQALAASAMWAANAATVSPSPDCADGRLHLSVANLNTMLHRALEAPGTFATLAAIFPDSAHFALHGALPPHAAFGDEGAANHMRLCANHGAPGLEIFVHGREAGETGPRFPARQTLETGRAIARLHGLSAGRTIQARQAAAAIEAGAFHNDVVAVANETALFHHEDAFADTAALYADIRAKADGLFEPHFVMAPRADVPLSDAVAGYLFNAQLVSRPGASRMTLVVPEESRETASVWAYLQSLPAGNGPIGEVIAIDVRQSMRNGGGPACLRLRIVLTPAEQAAMRPGFLLEDALFEKLSAWVQRRYRETLGPEDLADPALLVETRTALDELTQILPLGPSFYAFQRDASPVRPPHRRFAPWFSRKAKRAAKPN